jgi:drug/metabolite transporter (DMT)-like permease
MTTAASAPPHAQTFAAADLGLFAGTVLVWGTTWLAVKFQVGVVDPQISLLWRFLIAAPIMFAICALTRSPLRFPARTHLRFAAFGVFGCGVNFLMFYNAASYVVSGLLSVIFALASVTNILLGVLILGDPFRPRVAVGALLGVAGVGLMFAPEMTEALGMRPLLGLGLGTLGCLSFSFANIVSVPIRRAGVASLSINAWGIAYGVAFNAIAAVALGSPFTIEPTARYVLSLAWLSLPGTVIAFWMYLSLLGRVGPDRAGYTTVLSPVLALLVSTAVEGYRWSLTALLGLTLVAAGNLLILWRSRR